MKKSIIMLLSAIAFSWATSQAEDSRGRTATTIVADALAQLPAQKQKNFDNVMAELASTGAEGVIGLAEMLVPADKGENAKIEYALDGLVAYVTADGRSQSRDAVRDGLRQAIEKTADNPNRAFLMTLLQRCSTADDAPFFARFANDSYLAEWAVNGLIATPGSENEVIRLIETDGAPRPMLARAAASMRLSQAEPFMLRWAAEADSADMRDCFMALAATGSEKSLPLLARAARKCQYAWVPTGATEAYVALIENLAARPGSEKAALSAARKLLSSTDRQNVRGAALNVIFALDGKKAAPLLVKAMGDKSRDYRVNALRRARPWADSEVFDKLGRIAVSGKNDEVRADIINWFGSVKATDQTDAVISAIASDNSEVKTAAIKAAGRIGGQKSLDALVGLLGSDVSAEAEAALLAFNGKVNDGVMKALDGDNAMKKAALSIASKRKMKAASPKVFDMISTSDADLRSAACKALSGVVAENDFDRICALIEQSGSDCDNGLIAALQSSVSNATPDHRYEMLMKQIEKSSTPSNYYMALAQNANADAVSRLLDRYNNGAGADRQAAFNALLTADRPEMTDILYDIARDDKANRSAALKRYAALTGKADITSVRKYQLYRKGVELSDDPDVRKLMIKGLGSTSTLQALMTASRYLDDNEASQAAAAAVRSIVSKNIATVGGKSVRASLEKARDIYSRGTTADDGYAVDDINGLLARLGDNDFEKIADNIDRLSPEKHYENFEMMFEWQGDGLLTVRSVPVASLGREADTTMTCNGTIASNGDWNSAFVKVVNDRLTVIHNGETVVENKTLVNTTDPSAPAPASGKIAVAGSDSFKMRDVYMRELPSTPVFTLSPEEEADGFKNLFDGRSMHHWTGNTTDYVPVDGNIYVTAAYGNGGNLYTVDQYGDFVLRFEFCFEKEGVNNGVGIRTPMGVDAAYHGMEIQILDHDAPIYRKLREYQVHGSVYGVIPAKRIKHPRHGEWSTEEIRAVGDRITVTVNGEVILDGDIRLACQGNNVAPDGSKTNPYTVDRKNHPGLFNKKGHIGFLGHGAGVKFRNIRVKSLD